LDWTFQADRPIYIQIKERIKVRIVSGAYAPGDRLPAVRDMALEAEVNPNTMQKALSELERDGLLHTQRTSGRFVTEDGNMIQEVKLELARTQIAAFLTLMAAMGYDARAAAELILAREKGEVK
jgi:DNA-binding transcriptional regulator YhcF (GntR family)